MAVILFYQQLNNELHNLAHLTICDILETRLYFFKYIKITHGGLAHYHVSDLSCELNGPPLYKLRGLQNAILKDTLIIICNTEIQNMTEG